MKKPAMKKTMMRKHWAVNYIGRPYGERPGAFTCWELVREVMAQYYGHALPAIPLPPDDLTKLVKIVGTHELHNIWRPVDLAQEGDLVLLGRAHQPVHCGVYLAQEGGGVLHAVEKIGVIFTKIGHLCDFGWGKIWFHRARKDRSSKDRSSKDRSSKDRSSKDWANKNKVQA